MISKFLADPCEDSLTAAVFGHLLHLPSEVFWQLLRDACPALPSYPGEPLAVHAWPNWNAAGTPNSDRVIPDLVMEFEAFDLIIEAKRWDRPMQDRRQWQAELQAYVNEYGGRRRQVKMIALGGTDSLHDESLPPVTRPLNPETGEESHTFVCPVHMCQWGSLLLACRRNKRLLEQGAHRDSRTLADERILNDLIDLFIRHAIEPVWWFEDFAFRSNLLTDRADADRQFFRNASLRFHSTT